MRLATEGLLAGVPWAAWSNSVLTAVATTSRRLARSPRPLTKTWYVPSSVEVPERIAAVSAEGVGAELAHAGVELL